MAPPVLLAIPVRTAPRTWARGRSRQRATRWRAPAVTAPTASWGKAVAAAERVTGRRLASVRAEEPGEWEDAAARWDGGGEGGASVAILSWMSGVSLDACELVSQGGGAGGKGANGGLGGAAEEGAEGGAGDTVMHWQWWARRSRRCWRLGGCGAGGNGGASHVLVYKGTAPAKSAGTTLTTGVGGVAGSVARCR